ncbi:prion-like-(Q/N-rich) domain-bearing protein 25 [Pomacea canaliculata]|uniref:prion-like-(Q/N-rich) domain-bearing protein 25 n=1 Tax=Pomacea canaliculata TaxID=400727 RepID=UPI000D729153|nr:prion-like-(Q/N-rich) domain-bearing protein 25 [Pomacea canaliculata]
MQAILLVTVFSCLLAAENVAAVAFGAACTGDADCTDENNACSTSKTCVCKDGFTMYGGACTANGGLGTACLSGSTCTGDTLVCESSVCKKKAGQTCTAAAECVSSSTCSTTCNCNSGYTALTTGLCNGVAPQSVSFWLLTGSLITFLVTFSLP